MPPGPQMSRGLPVLGGCKIKRVLFYVRPEGLEG